MPFIKLKQLKFKDLYLTSFEKYMDLKAAKLRAKEKGFGIGYTGRLSDVEEFEAHRWVADGPGGYRNYAWLLTNGKSTGLTAVQSLETALKEIGGSEHEWILIWQG